MKFNSLRVKLPLIIILSYALATLLVQFLVNQKMTEAINIAKESEYHEKLHVALRTIQHSDERLQKTRMVATYREDFQKLTLRQLQENFQVSAGDVSPAFFVVSRTGQLLLTPPGNEASPEMFSQHILRLAGADPHGDFYLKLDAVGTVWCIFEQFEPWGWVVGYQVPVAVKYQMANQLTHSLWLVFGIMLVLVLVLLSWLVQAQLRPITELAEISAEMAQGQLDRQILVGRSDEIGILGTNFNSMQRSIKETIESLRSSEENLQITLDSIGDAVIATDAKACVTRMNPIAEELTGWPMDDALGQPLEKVFHIVNKESREPVPNPAQEVLERGEMINLVDNTLLINRDGREFLIDDSAAPIRNADNLLLGVVLVFRDVTEEKAVQDQLLQSRKMDTIGQLAGGVAHDFNNMLGGIIGSAELLKRKLPEDERSQKFLGVILESAERAAELTGKLLAFARKQHVSSTPVDAHLALHNSLSLLESTIDRRVKIHQEFEAASSTVVGDLSQLQTAFLNLCINATHAMPNGGDLIVSTKIIELDKVYCEVSSFDLTPGLFLEIEFRDSGCGIPTEQLNKIFDPFFTTKEQGKGTGLGLPAVLGTIQSHKGEITVYSELGTGTVFHILLPLSERTVASQESVIRPQRGSGLIMVVDDEAVMRATAGAILEDLGYQVLLAENGRAGLELFKERQQEIDLVLLDMIMPEMNGRDCFHRIREIDPKAKVVLSSGFTRTEDLADLRALGLSGFIAKPFRGSALSQSVAEVLGKG